MISYLNYTSQVKNFQVIFIKVFSFCSKKGTISYKSCGQIPQNLPIRDEDNPLLKGEIA